MTSGDYGEAIAAAVLILFKWGALLCFAALAHAGGKVAQRSPGSRLWVTTCGGLGVVAASLVLAIVFGPFDLIPGPGASLVAFLVLAIPTLVAFLFGLRSHQRETHSKEALRGND